MGSLLWYFYQETILVDVVGCCCFVVLDSSEGKWENLKNQAWSILENPQKQSTFSCYRKFRRFNSAWWSISMVFFGCSSGWPRPGPKRKRESIPTSPFLRCENVSFREGRWEPQQNMSRPTMVCVWPNLVGSMLTSCQNHTLSLHHSHHHLLLSHSTFRTTLSNAPFHGVKYHISPAMTMLNWGKSYNCV